MISSFNKELEVGDVHLWLVDLWDCYVQKMMRTIPPTEDELTESSIILSKEKKFEYVVRHRILRIILGSYLNVAPDELTFHKASSSGKLALDEEFSIAGKRMHFSMSDSSGCALFAFALERRVGVDFERVRVIPEALRFVNRFFSSREQAEFRRLCTNEQSELFLKYWTCKEAFLKACGKGLSYPLDQVELCTNEKRSLFFHRIGESEEEASRWRLRQDKFFPDMIGAVVSERIQGCEDTASLRTFPSDFFSSLRRKG
jgi:4'-phosphopantetheinyl transferase